MNIKVGDKVRVLEITGLNATSNCGIGTVLTVDSLKGITAERPIVAINSEGKIAGYFNEKALELIEPKKTKNQRITALEKEVESLKSVLAEILEIKKPTEIMKAIPSTTAEIIEFEGNQYRKVDREARKGDVVIFKDGIKPVDWITIGKPYKATKGVDDCEKGEFIGDICGEFPIYRYDDFNRTRKTVDVYELIKQELTPNQQRAEIIEKAKKFVEVKSECVKDSTYVEGGYSRKKIENPNYDYLAAEKVEFIINQEKRTVVSLVKFYNGSIMTKGIAKCNPSDVFNEHIGKAIALGRALGLDVSEFEQAVQPDEVVKGTEVFYRRDGYASTFTQIVESVGDVEMANQDLNVKDDKGWSCKIINDTNAQYEEVK